MSRRREEAVAAAKEQQEHTKAEATAAVARVQKLEAQLHHQRSESIQHSALHKEQISALQAELAEASQQQVAMTMFLSRSARPLTRSVVVAGRCARESVSGLGCRAQCLDGGTHGT